MESIFSECFAYEKHKGDNGIPCCGVLTEDLCKKYGKCSFFKTVEQFNADRKRARMLRKKRKEEECQ